VLIYPDYKRLLPEQVDSAKADKEYLRKITLDHVTNTTTKFKDRIYCWDVVNEVMTSPDYTAALGKSILVDYFKAAHAADPLCKLALTDFGVPGYDKGHEDFHYDLVKYLLDKKAPISTVGIQAHVGIVSPPQIIKQLERFASLGLDVEITEFTYSNPNEEFQGKYIRDFLIAAFSVPSVSSFVTWGFVEGQVDANAGFFRKDWSIKPSGKAWLDLFNKQWWTRTAGVTDVKGLFTTRAFLGTHDLTVKMANGSEKKIRIKLDAKGLEKVLIWNGTELLEK
jgi:GH35 family endo-1,4-beta-xylanase